MKHTYTTVRQQINELVPELLELKFGVETEGSLGFKILGAEPQLHHVLKAMRSTGRVTAGAQFFLKIWNLDESLSGQSQDVLDFIGEVLSK